MIQMYFSEKFNEENRTPLVYLIGYVGIFFLLWTLSAFKVLPFLKIRYPEFYLFDVFKLLIWTLPVFAYLKYENADALAYLKLRTVTRTGAKWAILISLIFIAYQFIGKMVIAEPIKFNIFFDANKWIKGCLIGRIYRRNIIQRLFSAKNIDLYKVWICQFNYLVIVFVNSFPWMDGFKCIARGGISKDSIVCLCLYF